MLYLWIAIGLTWIAISFIVWLQLQALRQSGAVLVRLDALEMEAANALVATRDGLPSGQMDLDNAPDGLAVAQSHDHPTLPFGSPAPPFDLRDLDGKRYSLHDFAGKPVLIAFFSPRCGYCTEIAADLAAMSPTGEGGRPVPLVVTNGTAKENREWVQQYGYKGTVLLQDGMEVATRYEATGTPMGYLIDADGRIASKIAVGGSSIVDLMPVPPGMTKKPLSESKIARDGLLAGVAAPDFTLPDLTRSGGHKVSLSQFLGQQVMLVFSDPQCGPCMELVPDLQRLHMEKSEVQILMVTRGDRAANLEKIREYGLTFPIGLQKQWEISKKYAMFATPVAYLVDEGGVIARAIAVGVDDVLAMAAELGQAPDVRKEVPA